MCLCEIRHSLTKIKNSGLNPVNFTNTNSQIHKCTIHKIKRCTLKKYKNYNCARSSNGLSCLQPLQFMRCLHVTGCYFMTAIAVNITKGKGAWTFRQNDTQPVRLPGLKYILLFLFITILIKLVIQLIYTSQYGKILKNV